MDYSDIVDDLDALSDLTTDKQLESLRNMAKRVVLTNLSTEALITMIGEGFCSTPDADQKAVSEHLADMVEDLTPEYLPHLPAAGHRA